MPTLVSGLINTDIMNFIDCPECSQAAGTCCTSYKGKKQSTPHKSRAAAYAAKFSDRTTLYKDSPDRRELILRYNQKLIMKASTSRS